MDFNLLVVVGFAVATMSVLIKIIGVPDQIKQNSRRKSTEGLSLRFYILSFVTFFLWGIYGALKDDWIVLLAQGALGCLTTGIILFQFFLYRKRNDKV